MATPLLDQIQIPADLKKVGQGRAAADRRRIARRTDRRGVGHRRPFRRRAGRGRTDRGAALCVRHAERQADLGCRPSGLSAQDSHRPRATASAPSARAAACPASPGAAKANSIRSARPIPRPRFRRRWAWRWRAICKAAANHVIAVIGDGAMSAGMAYEAINNAGAMKSRLIVVLNDNAMSIAPPVGALDKHLRELVAQSGRRGLALHQSRLPLCRPGRWP